jgi:ubiquinone/menaquinone biosynthesis C-methylase UbiE
VVNMASHSTRTDEQFGRSAKAYLSSTVHSQGPDLVTLSELAAKGAVDRVLDLGCGAGHVSFAVAPYVQSLVAYDLSDRMLQVVRDESERRKLANISTKQGLAERLPFAEKEFDWVCTRYSAHHWQDIQKALGEAFRVLRQGGVLFAIDTCSTSNPLLDTHLQAIELLRDGSHVRNYTPAEWSSKLEAVGFQIGSFKSWKIRIEFDAWVERMQTPALHVETLRSLLGNSPQEVRDFLEIAEDCSFSLNSMLMEARRLR